MVVYSFWSCLLFDIENVNEAKPSGDIIVASLAWFISIISIDVRRDREFV